MGKEGDNRGRGKGRGGRGQGKGGKRYFSNKTPELKFAPQNVNKPQTATYATVKDSIVQYVQKTYKDGHDVAVPLRDMQKKDLKPHEPTRKLSKKSDADAKKIEQDGFDIVYQAALTRYMDRCETLDAGLNKAYSLIFTTYCTKAMQSRIEEHPDFETKIQDDPIALLEAIKTLKFSTRIFQHVEFFNMLNFSTRVDSC